jgi:hypothetical protein
MPDDAAFTFPLPFGGISLKCSQGSRDTVLGESPPPEVGKCLAAVEYIRASEAEYAASLLLDHNRVMIPIKRDLPNPHRVAARLEPRQIRPNGERGRPVVNLGIPASGEYRPIIPS